jgi:hypothetical protein
MYKGKFQARSIKGMIDLIGYREFLRRKGRVTLWTYNPFGELGRIDISTADKIAAYYGEELKALWNDKGFDASSFVERMLKDYPYLREHWEQIKTKEDF